MKLRFSLFLLSVLTFWGCSQPERTSIVTGNQESLAPVAVELAGYLSATYPKELFEVVSQPVDDGRNILLQTGEMAGVVNEEAYRVAGGGNTLVIGGPTPRAVAYGAYALLRELGWDFYLSFEVPPHQPEPLDFDRIALENEPLQERRILFNWHNFITGCTGWDYPQWEEWIDNGLKTGYNTVMVHAYGNNPMHSFTFNGETKPSGYLTTTQKGRDWGAQHVNDVRRLQGGFLFTGYEFGSEAAKVPEEQRVEAATKLMQRVFRHAAEKQMEVCFALDVDTWMANPQNIIHTLPADALVEIGGFQTVNPDHPAGRAYYKAQLTQLLADYPEITVLAAWMRTPALKPVANTVWLLHNASTLPKAWRQEFRELIRQHPELSEEAPYPGIFAVSKIVRAFREILDEINPAIELTLGSWRLYYPKQSDLIMPDYCGFMPLDYETVFNQPQVIEELAQTGAHRKLYPIVWAHHDDHRYIGRPYLPYENFNRLLNQANAGGFGIIHWTTHPLDLFFNNYNNQVWQQTADEPVERSVERFVTALLKSDDKNLHDYFRRWYVEAPMFGRETSNFFMSLNEDYHLDGYGSSEAVVEKAVQRLALLEAVEPQSLTAEGLRHYRYQVGMERFIIAFFENHHLGVQAARALSEGKRDEAAALVQKTDPASAVEHFAQTIREYGATRGEEGLLISLNLRWLPDYIDLRQQTGLEPLRIHFQPTSHDPLAQGKGTNTFFVDDERKVWLSLGEAELNCPAGASGSLPLARITDSWLVTEKPCTVPLKTMRGRELPPAEYEITLFFAGTAGDCQIRIVEDEKQIADFSVSKGAAMATGRFRSEGGRLSVELLPGEAAVQIAGLVVDSV